MNTFDIGVLIVLALGCFAGFQKGLLTGVAGFAGKILAIGVAVGLHKQVLTAVEPLLGLRGKVEPEIAKFLNNIVESKVVSGGQFGNSVKDNVQPVIGDATVALTDYLLKIIAIMALFFVAMLLINLLISLLITPLAKKLSFADKGGGLLFGFFSVLVVISLVVGLLSPFLATGNLAGIRVDDSLLYPWLIRSYNFLYNVIITFAGDILTNPLEKLAPIREISI